MSEATPDLAVVDTGRDELSEASNQVEHFFKEAVRFMSEAGLVPDQHDDLLSKLVNAQQVQHEVNVRNKLQGDMISAAKFGGGIRGVM